MYRSILTLALAALTLTLTGCWSVIDSGEAGVYYSAFSGTDTTRVIGEGTEGHWPWANISAYSVRTQNTMENMSVLDRNGLDIETEISVLYRPEQQCLPQLHVTYGESYYDQFIQPNFRSAVRAAVGQYTAEQLYSTGRDRLQGEILEDMQRVAAGKCVVIDDVLIRDVDMPDNIRQAIERKLTEEQAAATYVYTLRKDSLEAQRRKIEADGLAEYNRTIEQSMTPNVLRYEAIQATRELANSDNSKIVIMGGNENGGLPIIMNND